MKATRILPNTATPAEISQYPNKHPGARSINTASVAQHKYKNYRPPPVFTKQPRAPPRNPPNNAKNTGPPNKSNKNVPYHRTYFAGSLSVAEGSSRAGNGATSRRARRRAHGGLIGPPAGRPRASCPSPPSSVLRLHDAAGITRSSAARPCVCVCVCTCSVHWTRSSHHEVKKSDRIYRVALGSSRAGRKHGGTRAHVRGRKQTRVRPFIFMILIVLIHTHIRPFTRPPTLVYGQVYIYGCARARTCRYARKDARS